ncbi:hypothetical protein VTO42DRAFT_1287 [Malbranchea cinnamomea]
MMLSRYIGRLHPICRARHQTRWNRAHVPASGNIEFFENDALSVDISRKADYHDLIVIIFRFWLTSSRAIPSPRVSNHIPVLPISLFKILIRRKRFHTSPYERSMLSSLLAQLSKILCSMALNFRLHEDDSSDCGCWHPHYLCRPMWNCFLSCLGAYTRGQAVFCPRHRFS